MKIIKTSSLETTFSEKLFHGTNISDIKEFLPSQSSVRGFGIFFSDSVKYAKKFGNHVYICNVTLTNPKEYEDSLDLEVDIMRNGDVNKLYELLKTKNHDGVIILKSTVSVGKVKEVICFSSNSVKIIGKYENN